MERTRILATAVADGAAALEAGLWAAVEVLLTGDLLAGERALQQVLRQVGSAVEGVVLRRARKGRKGWRAAVRSVAGSCTW